MPDAIRGFLSPRPALGAVVPPTRPPGTFFHGLMFWLQMGRHKERAINSSRAPPPGLHDDRESQQRDSTCVNEPQRWQEERQAQLCLARMPAAVVPDTRPAPHRGGGSEAHAEACTPQEQQPLYAPVLAAASPASPASTQLPHTWIPQVASGCSGTNRYGRAASPRDQAFCDFPAIYP